MKKIFALLALFLLAGCATLPEEEFLPLPVIEPPNAAPWQTMPVHRGDVVNDTVTMPVFASERQETLHFSESGLEIEGVFIANGDIVAEGQIIAAILNPELDEELEDARRARSRLELELSQLDERHEFALAAAEIRGEPVDDSFYLARREQLLEQISFAQIEYNELAARDEARYVRAPMDGVARNVLEFTEGQLSSAAAVVAIIEDMSQAFFRIQRFAPEHIQPGDRLTLTIVHLAFDIEVESVIPDGIENVGTSAWFRPVGGYDLFFQPGTLGRIRHVFDEAFDVVVVPTRVLRTQGERDFVFVLEDGVRRQRFVEIGLRSHGYAEILSGLEVGELVIV